MNTRFQGQHPKYMSGNVKGKLRHIKVHEGLIRVVIKDLDLFLKEDLNSSSSISSFGRI
jgi:hypothetical protein